MEESKHEIQDFYSNCPSRQYGSGAVWRLGYRCLLYTSLYGDMAQLETGTTVSRCNLIDNGDFQLGSTDFEKKAYYEDGLTSVGSENVRPVNRAVTVTAAGTSYIYDRPSLNGKKVASVQKWTHLYASVSLPNENSQWYRVENAEGKRGYFPASRAFAYLGGNDGDNCGAVAVTGAILRASASDSGAIVEEVIPRGTSVVDVYKRQI